MAYAEEEALARQGEPTPASRDGWIGAVVAFVIVDVAVAGALIGEWWLALAAAFVLGLIAWLRLGN
jgi:hypothetical protein